MDDVTSSSDDTPQASPLPLLRSNSVKSEGSPRRDSSRAASLRAPVRSGSLPAVEVRQEEEIREGVEEEERVTDSEINGQVIIRLITLLCYITN